MRMRRGIRCRSLLPGAYAPNRRMRLRAVLEDPRSSASRRCSMGERRLLPPAAQGERWEDGFPSGLLNSLCVFHLLSWVSGRLQGAWNEDTGRPRGPSVTRRAMRIGTGLGR